MYSDNKTGRCAKVGGFSALEKVYAQSTFYLTIIAGAYALGSFFLLARVCLGAGAAYLQAVLQRHLSSQPAASADMILRGARRKTAWPGRGVATPSLSELHQAAEFAVLCRDVVDEPVLEENHEFYIGGGPAREKVLNRYSVPEIYNTDQGSQFTSYEFARTLREAGARIFMGGRGHWVENVIIECPWRSLKYECVYLRELETGSELRQALPWWFDFYNTHRPHRTFNGQKPMEIYQKTPSQRRSTPLPPGLDPQGGVAHEIVHFKFAAE